MANIAALEARNAARWAAMHLRADRLPELDRVARKIFIHKARYVAIEQLLVSVGKSGPWWFVGIAHERESGCNFMCQLGQGDPLGEVSVHDPAGRGPFFGADAFERSCYDALIDCGPHAANWTLWTPGGVATIFEEYNGLGYADMGVPSAYVWSGSDQYSHGKYVADHVYRDGVIDVQEGCMPLLSRLMAIDPEIKFAPGPGRWPLPAAPVQPKPPVSTGGTTPAPAGYWTSLIAKLFRH